MPRAIVAATVDARTALPADLRERTAVVGHSYVVAAHLDAHSGEAALPPAHSLDRGYGCFRPPGEESTAALFVGGDPGALRAAFTDTVRVGSGDVETWLLTGRTEPWTEVWPRLRSLSVL